MLFDQILAVSAEASLKESEEEVAALKAKIEAMKTAVEAILRIYNLDIGYDVEKFPEVQAWRAACAL